MPQNVKKKKLKNIRGSKECKPYFEGLDQNIKKVALIYNDIVNSKSPTIILLQL